MTDSILNQREEKNKKAYLTSNQQLEFIFMPILLIGGCIGAILLADRLIPTQSVELVLWPIILGILIGVIPGLVISKLLESHPVNDVELVIRGSLYITAGLLTIITVFIIHEILDTEIMLKLLGMGIGTFSIFISIVSGITLLRTTKKNP
jgi:Na+/H+-translocating membrane pyrophosphatase